MDAETAQAIVGELQKMNTNIDGLEAIGVVLIIAVFFGGVISLLKAL